MRGAFIPAACAAALLAASVPLQAQETPKPKVVRFEREPAEGFITRGSKAAFIAYVQNADSVEYRFFAVGCGGCEPVLMGAYAFPLEGRVRFRLDISFSAGNDADGSTLRDGSWHVDVVAIRRAPNKKGEVKRHTDWKRMHFMVR